jgi:hypothetical protein
MDARLTDIVRARKYNTSPYQTEVNDANKGDLIRRWNSSLYYIWAVPLAITFLEAIYLKHGKVSSANKVGLFKWVSIIGAGVATNLATRELLRKMQYFNIIYPNPPKVQLENLRDTEILKGLAKH